MKGKVLTVLLLTLVLSSCASALTTVDVTVDWTCVGAHGMTGVAAENDLRIIDMTWNNLDSVAVHNLLETDWFGQPWVPNVPDPVEPGTTQTFTFSSYGNLSLIIEPGHTYAISMKARNDDDPPLWGALGNIYIFTTPEPTGPPDAITDIRVTVQVIVEVSVP